MIPYITTSLARRGLTVALIPTACACWPVGALLVGCSSSTSEQLPNVAVAPSADGGIHADSGTGELGYALMQSDVELITPTLDATTTSAFANERRAFALSLYHQIKQAEDNLFYSPHSISTALAMAFVGARGATQTEMATALQFGLPEADEHAGFNAQQRALLERAVPASENSSGLILETHNDIWAHVDPLLRPNQDYVDALALNYAAPIKLVDFDLAAGEVARAAINQEVGRQTHDLITELLPQGVLIPNHTTMVLTNTIYMKAAWATPFVDTETRPGVFTDVAGQTHDVSLMHQVGSFEYAEIDDVQALRIPYVGAQIALTVLLPKAGTWATFETTLQGSTLETIEAQYTVTQVGVALPKLKLRSRPALAPALKALGMLSAFNEAAADFSGIGPGQAYIQDVIHEAFIELDETGTEAGAATAVIFGTESAGPIADVEFVADHPFFFMLEDIPTGAILFAGRVMTP